GLVFAADRLAARSAADITASCTQLNVGKGDRCGRAYLTREQFDEIFAQVEATAKASSKDTVFAEKLRLFGTRRLAPNRPVDKIMAVRARLASLEPASVIFQVDPTLRTSFLDRATIFRMLLEDPMTAPDTRVS